MTELIHVPACENGSLCAIQEVKATSPFLMEWTDLLDETIIRDYETKFYFLGFRACTEIFDASAMEILSLTSIPMSLREFFTDAYIRGYIRSLTGQLRTSVR